MADILKLISKGESEIVEFKSSFNTEVIETLVAFANTKGGYVCVGISDNAAIIGVDINQESIRNWLNEIKNITVEKLFLNNYSSNPRNKIIANICKDLGWIEKYGTGFGRVCQLLKAYGLPLPSVEDDGAGIKVTVYGLLENVTENVTEDVTENVTETRRLNILQLIKENDKISTTEIAKLIGVVRRTIARDIDTLKEKGVIKRIGPDKGGYWEVQNA